MVDLALLDGVAQGAHDVLLAHDVRERARAVAAVQRGAGGHGRSECSGPAAADRSPPGVRLSGACQVLLPAGSVIVLCQTLSRTVAVPRTTRVRVPARLSRTATWCRAGGRADVPDVGKAPFTLAPAVRARGRAGRACPRRRPRPQAAPPHCSADAGGGHPGPSATPASAAQRSYSAAVAKG